MSHDDILAKVPAHISFPKPTPELVPLKGYSHLHMLPPTNVKPEDIKVWIDECTAANGSPKEFQEWESSMNKHVPPGYTQKMKLGNH